MVVARSTREMAVPAVAKTGAACIRKYALLSSALRSARSSSGRSEVTVRPRSLSYRVERRSTGIARFAPLDYLQQKQVSVPHDRRFHRKACRFVLGSRSDGAARASVHVQTVQVGECR